MIKEYKLGLVEWEKLHKACMIKVLCIPLSLHSMANVYLPRIGFSIFPRIVFLPFEVQLLPTSIQLRIAYTPHFA